MDKVEKGVAAVLCALAGVLKVNPLTNRGPSQTTRPSLRSVTGAWIRQRDGTYIFVCVLWAVWATDSTVYNRMLIGACQRQTGGLGEVRFQILAAPPAS